MEVEADGEVVVAVAAGGLASERSIGFLRFTHSYAI
jgi:hypothetical protein